MKKFLLCLMVLFFPVFAFAEDLPAEQFLSQVLAAVAQFGGLPWMAKIASICLLLTASMKVPFIRSLLWDKLGKAQALVAPLLGLAAGILSMQPITLPGVLAYVGAGAGAIILYELLDFLKVPAASNAMVLGILNFLQSLIKK